MTARVRVVTTEAAPSPTAVLMDAELPSTDPARADRVRSLLAELRRAGWNCSKVTVVHSVRRGRIGLDFLQAHPGTGAGDERIEPYMDCGNSMVATAIAVADPAVGEVVHVRNGASRMAVDVRVRARTVGSASVRADFTQALARRRPADFLLTDRDLVLEGVRVTVLRAMNLYAVVRAGDLGVATTALSAREPDRDLLDLLRRIRRAVARRWGLPPAGESPKIAVIGPTDADVVLARTVYLDQWHPGLPLTGAVSVALATLATPAIATAGRVSTTVMNHQVASRLRLVCDEGRVVRCEATGLKVMVRADLTL